MKKIISIIGLFAALSANAALTNAPALIELRDQFDTPQKLSFPTTNITLLTVADKAGSEQIAGWIAPVKRLYGTRIEIHGIADMSTVPGLLRGRVRKAFQKEQTYPVMMDWSGDVVKVFNYLPEKANLFLIDGNGRVLKHVAGEATEAKVKKLCAEIDSALANRDAGQHLK